MKILFFDENKLIIYLNNYYCIDLDLKSKDNLEKYFRALFLKINKNYDILLSGYYEIEMFYDSTYGIVIEINKDNLDYFDYYNDTVDMRIKVNNSKTFLYEIEDIFILSNDILKKGILYKYNNKLYLHFIKKVTDIDIGKVLEFASIEYKKVDEIIRKGTVLNIENYLCKY